MPRSENPDHLDDPAHDDCNKLDEERRFRRSHPDVEVECDARRGDPALVDIAAARHGLVSRCELEAIVGPGAVTHRVREKRLHRQHRGVYLLGHPVRPPLAREAAALLAVGADAKLSYHTAAAVDGYGVLDAPEVHVTLAGRRARSRDGIRVHWTTDWGPKDLVRHRGLELTSPARTLLDLASVLSPEELEMTAERAHVCGRYSRREMLEMLRRHPRARGSAVLRDVLLLEDEPRLLRSRAERLMLRLVREAGLPDPECNVRVAGWERDFVWRREKLIVEVDGWQFHSSRAAFERDRRRDASAVAAGLRVMRVTWRRLRRERAGLLLDLARALAAP
jgi:very-short-patch-repair endonuclease